MQLWGASAQSMLITTDILAHKQIGGTKDGFGKKQTCNSWYFTSWLGAAQIEVLAFTSKVSLSSNCIVIFRLLFIILVVGVLVG